MTSIGADLGASTHPAAVMRGGNTLPNPVAAITGVAEPDV